MGGEAGTPGRKQGRHWAGTDGGKQAGGIQEAKKIGAGIKGILLY